MREELGVVIIPMDGDRQVVMLPGSGENEHKWESSLERRELRLVAGCEFPGGVVEERDGGSCKVAAAREFREEAGLEVDPSRMRRLPGEFRIVQRRDGDEMVGFSVVCFLLRLGTSEVGDLINRGALVVGDGENGLKMRPRDEDLFERVRGQI